MARQVGAFCVQIYFCVLDGNCLRLWRQTGEDATGHEDCLWQARLHRRPIWGPELTKQEEEQSLQIHAFTTRLEEDADGGPLAIARHLARHVQPFVEPGREPRVDANLFLHKIRDPVPMMDTEPDPVHSQFLGAPTHAAITRQT